MSSTLSACPCIALSNAEVIMSSVVPLFSDPCNRRRWLSRFFCALAAMRHATVRTLHGIPPFHVAGNRIFAANIEKYQTTSATKRRAISVLPNVAALGHSAMPRYHLVAACRRLRPPGPRAPSVDPEAASSSVPVALLSSAAQMRMGLSQNE